MNVTTRKQKPRAMDSLIMTLVRNMAIKSKLISIIMMTCIVALLLAGAAFVMYERMRIRHDMVNNLMTQAQMMAENCKAALAFEDVKDAQETLKAFRAEPAISFGCIRTKDGKIFAEYYRDETDITIDFNKVPQDDYRFDERFLTVSKSIILEGETIGSVSLWSDLHPIDVMFRRNTTIIIAVLIFSSMAAYLVSSRLQRVISAPILSLAGVAKEVSENKEYSTRAVKHSNDEVGLLIDSFNEMLGQIQQRDIALVSTNEELESRVQQRTAELTTANEQLIREIAYRKKAEEILKRRTEQIIHHQSALLRLGKMSKISFTAILKATTEEAAKTLEVERVGIWLFDQEQSELVCEDLYKKSEDIHDKEIGLKVEDYPKYFQALESNRIVAANDARKDPRTNEFSKDYLEPFGITSMMDVPVRLHGKIVGVICHEHIGPTREWALEEQDFAASVADMISLQLEATERRKAEQALRESEHRYRTLLKNIPQKIFYKDINSVYLLCNESYAEDLKISPDEIRGKTDFDFHPKELAKKYIYDDKRIMQSGKAEEIEEKYIKDGQELIVRTLKSPVRDEQERIIGIFGIFWDITSRKNAEQALEKLNKDLELTVQELRRSNKELQDFAYVTAHDLKAPLRAIGTLADWISTDYSEKFDEQGRYQVQLLKGRVSRMGELIDSILRYSEIGQTNRRTEKINLNELVEGTIAQIAPPEKILITIENELPTVMGEKTHLKQIFQNLINNAVKFMDKPQGQIKIGCIEENDFWKFSIADNGPGIAERHFDKIFEVFQTLASRDEIESTGIGLAVVKKIVELYGGKVWVESRIGQGSTFFFTLPKHEMKVEDYMLEANIARS